MCVLMVNALPYMHVLHEHTNPKPAKFLKFMLFMNNATLLAAEIRLIHVFHESAIIMNT
jgi:hypothetical protein